MSKKFIKQNIKLSLEFDKYVSHNPDTLKKIPNGACVVLTVKGDTAFNKSSQIIADKAKSGKQKCIEARKEGKRWVLQSLAA